MMNKPDECHHLLNEGVCVKCGLVLEISPISYEPEPIYSFDEDSATDRCGTTARFSDKTLGTDDVIFLTLSQKSRTKPELREALRRSRVWLERKKGWREKRTATALAELNRLVEGLGIPRTVQEEVANLYRRSPNDIFSGSTRRTVLGALVYIVCRQRHITRTYFEISCAIEIPEHIIVKQVKRLTELLGLQLPPASTYDLAKQYLPRFASQLGLDDEAVRRAFGILENNRNHRGSPIVFASACLYKATDKTMREIAEKIDVGFTNLCQTARSLVSPL